MPELPEVETMVRDLGQRLPGRTIRTAYVNWERLVAYPGANDFVRNVSGRMVAGVERRGKFALLPLDDGSTLAVHRGMTGSLFLRPRGAQPDRFDRAGFVLDDGSELRFDDSRKFGRLYLVGPDNSLFQPPWERLGPEPLGPEFTPALLHSRLARRAAAVKTTLLNQSVVAGVGNIYADEALFIARVHPTTPARELSKVQASRLRSAIVEVLTNAIEGRGTTFSTYRDVNGNYGLNQHRLNVFHRHGLPCPRCGTILQRIVLGTRGTHFCPRCQRRRS